MEAPAKEKVNVVTICSRKTKAAPLPPQRKEPIEESDAEEEEAKAQEKPAPQKEGSNLEKSSPKEINDIHMLPFLRQAKKPTRAK